ncbi:MAG: glycosyltransferase family 2 protein [Candidatus Limnocylindrales bacterium]|jgi:GT2 family glycosyltransferase
MALTVTVSIVLFNSAVDIEACLAALNDQTRPPDEVIILDNGSTDDGLARARAALPHARFLRSPVNLGFAGGQNRAMAFAPADIHLVLNPDARLRRDFLARSLAPFERDPRLGSVTGRLLRFRPEDPLGNSAELVECELPDDILDSTGMIAHRNRRVTDRGSNRLAAGRYLSPGYVFGPSGAAALYRREMLENVAYQGEIYDESFFSYREDVDLAWRAQLLGWRCEYNPAAVARHRRRVAPGRRGILPADINRNSVRNRWQLVLKNEIEPGLRRDWRQILYRDVQITGYLVLREQTSLRALGDVVHNLPKLWARRNDIMRRRIATDEEMLAWFGGPVERPLEEKAASPSPPPAGETD